MTFVEDSRTRLKLAFARSAPVWLRRAMGHPVAEPMDLSRIRVIRDADAERLSDVGHLERDVLPALGINADQPLLFPPELRGHLGQGLRYWQYPCQLAPYLVLLSSLGIRRYLEIGVQHGGTFVLTVEYLARFTAIERAIAIDLLDVGSLREFEGLRSGVSFVREDSSTQSFRELVEREGPFDLVLIDGDHNREAVRRDWQTVRSHTRAVAFHDIVDSHAPGVVETWTEVRSDHATEYDFHEFTAQYPEVVGRQRGTSLGIGVAIRRGTAA